MRLTPSYNEEERKKLWNHILMTSQKHFMYTFSPLKENKPF